MIYEANASSSACRLWRVHMVETSTPPSRHTHDSRSCRTGQWPDLPKTARVLADNTIKPLYFRTGCPEKLPMPISRRARLFPLLVAVAFGFALRGSALDAFNPSPY